MVIVVGETGSGKTTQLTQVITHSMHLTMCVLIHCFFLDSFRSYFAITHRAVLFLGSISIRQVHTFLISLYAP